MMVRCNNCPAFSPPGLTGSIICGISGWDLINNHNGEWTQDEADCPLKRLELKNGNVYEPEAIDG